MTVYHASNIPVLCSWLVETGKRDIHVSDKKSPFVGKSVIPEEGNFGRGVLRAFLDFSDSEAKRIEKVPLIHMNTG